MSKDEATFEAVVEVIARHARAPRDRITADGRLIDYGVDSVRAQQIVIDLEAAFGFEIPDRDVIDLETIGEIAGYVRRRQAERQG